MSLNFIIDELVRVNEPIEQVTVLTPLGSSLWITALGDASKGMYQVQCASVSPATIKVMVSNSEELIVMGAQGKQRVTITAQRSDIDGCFNASISDDDAKLVTRQRVAIYRMITKDLYMPDSLPAASSLRYWMAEESLAKLYARANPMSEIYRALNTNDYNVLLWNDYISGETECPEFDMRGNMLVGQEAQDRYKFWTDAQNALDEVAQKATLMQLANPIDSNVFTPARRKLQVEMILSALQMPSTDTSFDWLEAEGINRFLTEIKQLWDNYEAKPITTAEEPEEGEGVNSADPKDLKTSSAKGSRKLVK